MYKGVYIYPWHLAEERLEVALGRVREAGLNTITLSASCAAGPVGAHGGMAGVEAAAHGSVCFRARPARYGHIRPRVHPMVERFDALAELQRAAPDLHRVAWVASWRNTPLAEQHAAYVSRDAFGTPRATLCPAHPAVRDYMVNLCADLAHGYDLAAVILGAPGWACDQADPRGPAQAPLDRREQTLLALCFADATRRAAKAAGIDADRLQAETRMLLEQRRAAQVGAADRPGTDCWPAELASDPEWTAFLDWRCRQVADLVTAAKSALPAGTALAVLPTVTRGSAASRLAGSDLAMLAAAADALEIPLGRTSAADLSAKARDVRRRAGDDAALRFILEPDLAHGADAFEAALELKQVGPAGVAFHDGGRIRSASLGPIKAVLAALDE